MVLLSGQSLEVKCDVTSTAGAIFNAVVSFANLGELAYFGLAYVKGKCLRGGDGWPGTSGNPGLQVPECYSFYENCSRLGHLTLHSWKLAW